MTRAQFEQEAQALRESLLFLATALTGNVEDAEDVVQEAMLKMWAMGDELHSPIAPLAKVMVRHISADRQRRAKPTVSIDTTPVNDTPADIDTHERIERMMTIVGTLPPAQQVILRLRHMEGMTMTDIAQLTGGTETSVRKALSRARMTVRQLYHIE